ncbi:hypothetical protein BGW80DRAFT_448273 [Lactifluus volemus]|nr:hypothetical protein BGW80DRAFT_448273 [Lactifluus volemus]
MLLGIMRSSHGSSFGLWHLLYQQCFIWLVLATIADVPLMVLLILDLNGVYLSPRVRGEINRYLGPDRRNE